MRRISATEAPMHGQRPRRSRRGRPDNAEPSGRDLRDFDGFHSHPGLALGITGHSAL